MSDTHVLIKLDALQHTNQGRLLLDLQGLSLNAGVCTVLTGENGAGKSTLMQILAGLEPADRIELTVDGRPETDNSQLGRVVGKAAGKALRTLAVYLHQQPYLFDCSVRENLAYGLRYGKRVSRSDPSGSIDSRIDETLAWAGLAHLADRSAQALSGGERQRIALLRALLVQPTLLLLDEPTTGMDRNARQQTYDLLQRLGNSGITVLISTHDDLHHYTFASVHWELHNGRIDVTNFSESRDTILEDTIIDTR